MNVLLLVVVLFLCCSTKPIYTTQKSTKEIEGKESSSFLGPKNDLSKSDHREKVEDAIGILTLSDDYKFGDTIDVYESKGELLTTLRKPEEYQVIALRCLGQTTSFYHVILDNGKKGFISRYSKHIKFQTREEHILNLFSVRFNESSNPLMEQASSKSNNLHFDKDEYYHPDQIKGEWLRVKWGSENNWSYGWVKWKDKNRLAIEFYYFA